MKRTKSIKRLGHTRNVRKRRKDGVTQSYWVGKKVKTKHSKKLSYRQLKKRGWKGQRLTDTDGDKKVNVFDCKPLDAKRQDRDETYSGWKNWDTWATWLVLTNTPSTYNWLMSWNKNFKRKIKRGVFDREKGRYVVKKYLIPVARGKGMAKRFMSDPYGNNLTPEPDIDPKKVDMNEILDALLELDV